MTIKVTTTGQGIEIKLHYTVIETPDTVLESDSNNEVLFENIDLKQPLMIEPVNGTDRIVSVVTQST